MAKKTFEQYWLEKRDAERAAARAESRVPNSDIPHAVRQKIEQTIGRKLTAAEIIRGRLDRIDSRTDREKQADKFSIVMEAKADQVPYQSEIEEAERQVARERFALLSPAEKRLQRTKELSLMKLQEAASKANREARMADPTVVRALAALKDLQNRSAFDPSYSYSDCEAIERAIRQIETPGADIATGLALTDAAVKIFVDKQQGIVDKIKQQRADLESQLKELGDPSLEYAIPGQQPEDSDAAWDGKLFALGDVMNSKMAAYESLPKDAPSETRAAAMAEWRSATDAVAAHRQSDPAATPAAAAPAGEGT